MKLGIYGSTAHVLTNDKVVDKKGCLKELTKENFKNATKTVAIPAGLAGAAAGVTALADRFVPNRLASVTGKVAPNVEKVLGKIGQVLKTDVLTKFKGLPAPAKAAAVVGAVALAVVLPIMKIANIAHAGKIEGQHEVK